MMSITGACRSIRVWDADPEKRETVGLDFFLIIILVTTIHDLGIDTRADTRFALSRECHEACVPSADVSS
jgi:hypothetical protein